MFNFIITLLKTNLYFLEEKITSKSSNQTHKSHLNNLMMNF